MSQSGREGPSIPTVGTTASPHVAAASHKVKVDRAHNTLRKIARWKLRGATKWRRLYTANRAWFTQHRIPLAKAAVAGCQAASSSSIRRPGHGSALDRRVAVLVLEGAPRALLTANHHSASRTLTTNQPWVTGVSPDPESSSCGPCTDAILAPGMVSECAIAPVVGF